MDRKFSISVVGVENRYNFARRGRFGTCFDKLGTTTLFEGIDEREKAEVILHENDDE